MLNTAAVHLGVNACTFVCNKVRVQMHVGRSFCLCAPRCKCIFLCKVCICLYMGDAFVTNSCWLKNSPLPFFIPRLCIFSTYSTKMKSLFKNILHMCLSFTSPCLLTLVKLSFYSVVLVNLNQLVTPGLAPLAPFWIPHETGGVPGNVKAWISVQA